MKASKQAFLVSLLLTVILALSSVNMFQSLECTYRTDGKNLIVLQDKKDYTGALFI